MVKRLQTLIGSGKIEFASSRNLNSRAIWQTFCHVRFGSKADSFAHSRLCPLSGQERTLK